MSFLSPSQPRHAAVDNVSSDAVSNNGVASMASAQSQSQPLQKLGKWCHPAAILAAVFFLSGGRTAAEVAPAAAPLEHSQSFVTQLTTPHTGLVDGRSFREAVSIAAAPAGPIVRPINVWIDRKVNPDSPVFPGPLGPTRYASFCRIAEAADCVCYPLDNCVLIGRAEWVAVMLEGFFPATDAARRNKRVHREESSIDIQWPDLTTPDEAMELLRRRLAGQSLGYRETQSLPHDLWPAVALQDVSPRMVAALIAGQFLSRSPSEKPVRRTYSFPRSRHAFASISDIDPQAQVVTEGPQQTVTASPSAHVWLCEQLLGSDPSGVGQPPGASGGETMSGKQWIEQLRDDHRTFSLTVQSEPAGRVIQTLLASMNVRCQFDPSANRRLQQRVSFTAKDKTLWELLRLITEKASLKIEAAEDSLRISAEEES